jgi:predicted aldo/keto reductase-like oxidoreductase
MSSSQSDLTRRRFISTSLGGLAAAGVASLTPSATLAQNETPPPVVEEKKIIYRTLGRTGLKVPIVSMGVMNANNPEVIQASWDMGVRHFDTAAAYGYGRNEQLLGRVMKKIDKRSEAIIGTKIFRPEQREGLTSANAKAKAEKQCDGSLRRLKMDYVDIMYVHSVSDVANAANAEMMEGMAYLKEKGKVRYTAISTHRLMPEVIDEVVRIGFYDVILTSINVSMANNQALLDSIAAAAKAGVGIIAMKTQAGGSRFSPESVEKYPGAVVATAALKWVMRHENIATSIPGYDNFEHMNQDVSVAYNLQYTDEEQGLLSDNTVTLGMGFCPQCEQCLATCPHDVDIPGLMRTHMYASRYANFEQARFTLDRIASGRGLSNCVTCSDCTATCANTVSIRHNLEQLQTMYA